MKAGPALALLAAAALSACAPTAAVTRGAGSGIGATQALAATDLPRIAVGAIIDKTELSGEQSLSGQIARINAQREAGAELQVTTITAGLRDMLTTELFGSGQFIVVEREALPAVLAEQEFAQSAAVGDTTRIPLGELEGAELMVVGAITGFDAGLGGGALPIPVPLSRRGDFGVFHIRAKRGYVAMDLRLIDCATGRVLGSTAVEGSNWRFGLDFTGYFGVGHDHVKLPGLLRYFSNTPVEEALQKMVTAAVGEIGRRLVAAP